MVYHQHGLSTRTAYRTLDRVPYHLVSQAAAASPARQARRTLRVACTRGCTRERLGSPGLGYPARSRASVYSYQPLHAAYGYCPQDQGQIKPCAEARNFRSCTNCLPCGHAVPSTARRATSVQKPYRTISRGRARHEQEAQRTPKYASSTALPHASPGPSAHGPLPGIHQYGQCALLCPRC